MYQPGRQAQGLHLLKEQGARKLYIRAALGNSGNMLMQILFPQRLRFLPETVTAYFLDFSAYNSGLHSILALGFFKAVSS